jgi:hypothetical protein
MASGVLRRLWVGFILPLAFLSCAEGDNPTDLSGDEARLSVYLTDAPGDVAAVWIDIERISLQGDDGPVVLLAEPTGLVDITLLVDQTMEIVDDAEIPAGVYGQLRVRIENAVLETTDGAVYVLGNATHPDDLPVTGSLHCPSCSESGLKVLLHGMEVVEGEHSLVLDFDVTQSFGHEAGRSGKWIMRPVIHTAHVPGDGNEMHREAESIEGQVVLAQGVTIPDCPAQAARGLRAFVPTATAQTLVDGQGDPVVRTGSVDEDGEFEIHFVAADTYTLGYEGTIDYGDWLLEFTATVEPGEVTVADEDVEGVVYTVTGATCTAAPPAP